MIGSKDCRCTCGNDCSDVIEEEAIEPGANFRCPACRRLLGVDVADVQVRGSDGSLGTIEVLVTKEPVNHLS